MSARVFGYVVQRGKSFVEDIDSVGEFELGEPGCALGAWVFDSEDDAHYWAAKPGSNHGRVVPLVSSDDHERVRALLERAGHYMRGGSPYLSQLLADIDKELDP